MKIVVIISGIIAINLLSISGTKGKESLKLGMLFSLERNTDFSGFIPAIEIAFETVKADETLPFTFTYTYNNSMVSGTIRRPLYK